MNQRERMYQRIDRHGAQLNALFGTDHDNIELCKKLRRLEIKAHRLATDYCNGENGVNTENWEEKTEPIINKVKALLNPENVDLEVFVNGDPRGYALKIRFDDTDARRHEIYTDWGGYGILAPEFSGEA